VAWTELAKLGAGAQWHVRNAHQRLGQGNSPWADYRNSAKSVKAGMKGLRFNPD
jgi:bifunctional non-homologous end joining protein LigD